MFYNIYIKIAIQCLIQLKSIIKMYIMFEEYKLINYYKKIWSQTNKYAYNMIY